MELMHDQHFIGPPVYSGNGRPVNQKCAVSCHQGPVGVVMSDTSAFIPSVYTGRTYSEDDSRSVRILYHSSLVDCLFYILLSVD